MEEETKKKLKQDSGSEMVAIRWCRPNSVYDKVVQFISKSLVKKMGEEGNASVLWPHKGHESDI